MPTANVTPEEIDRISNMPGVVVRGALLREAVASCRLDGETQSEYKPVAAKAKLDDRRFKGMNKTEAQYARHLEDRQTLGEIASWLYGSVTIVVGLNRCRYTPDFFVIEQSGEITFVEVKGFWRDDARVKIKAAAKQYPWFRFKAVQRKKGQWEEESF